MPDSGSEGEIHNHIHPHPTPLPPPPEDGGIFDSGRGKLMMFFPPRLAVTGFEGDESVRGT